MIEEKKDEVKGLRIGEKIKSLRQSKGLNLNDLASIIGVSDAVLSQIENEVVAPPVAILLKLARVFEVKIGYFFEEEVQKRIAVTREEERKKVDRKHPKRHTPLSYSYQSLDSITERHMEPFLVEFDVDIHEDIQPVEHQGEEFVFLLEGELEFRTDKEVINLKKGDSLYFDSSIPHAFYGKGKNRAKAVIIIYHD